MLQLVRFFRYIMGISREVRYSRLMLVLVVLSGFISGVATTGLIALVNLALSGQGFHGIDPKLAFGVLCVGLPLFRFMSQALLVNLTQRTLYQLRLNWCRRILTTPIRQLEQIGPHRLLASLTNDLGAITEALLIVPVLIMHLAVILTCLIYLGWLSPMLLGFLIGFLIVGLVSYRWPVARAYFYGRRSRADWDTLIRQIQAVTFGAKELKMHGPRRQAMMERQIEPTARSLRHWITVGTYIFAAASSWGQILFFLAIGLMLFVLPEYQPVPMSVLLGYSVTLILMMAPLETLLSSVPRLSNAVVAMQKIDELGISLEGVPAEPETGLGAPPPSWQRLEVKGVQHTYRSEASGETFALGPIDLTIEAGELLFLIGGNGSGKTTFAKILLGLYPPEGGELRLDGVPITDANRDAYRQHFAAVFSDFYLFETLLGLEKPELDAEAQRYLRELQLDRKVKIEGGELSTIDLSQGQRKRLALLTAYLEDRPIYLFDEWAADQDPMFKKVFYHEILPSLQARGKTVVVISHDDHFYEAADRIVKLDYGRIEYDHRRAAA